MGVEENKSIVQKAFNDMPAFMEYIAEDIVWKIQGFKSFRGKQEVIQGLIMPLMDLMESLGRITITNIIAEDDRSEYRRQEYHERGVKRNAGKE